MLKKIENFLNNKNLVFILSIFVSIYAVFAAPQMPEQLKKLFDNRIFRFMIIFLISYYASRGNPRVALICSLVFLFFMNTVIDNTMAESYYNYRFYENFQNEEAETEDAESQEAESQEAESVEQEENKQENEEAEITEEQEADIDNLDNDNFEDTPSSTPTSTTSSDGEKKKKVMRLKCEVEEEFANPRF